MPADQLSGLRRTGKFLVGWLWYALRVQLVRPTGGAQQSADPTCFRPILSLGLFGLCHCESHEGLLRSLVPYVKGLQSTAERNRSRTCPRPAILLPALNLARKRKIPPAPGASCAPEWRDPFNLNELDLIDHEVHVGIGCRRVRAPKSFRTPESLIRIRARSAPQRLGSPQTLRSPEHFEA